MPGPLISVIRVCSCFRSPLTRRSIIFFLPAKHPLMVEHGSRVPAVEPFVLIGSQAPAAAPGSCPISGSDARPVSGRARRTARPLMVHTLKGRRYLHPSIPACHSTQRYPTLRPRGASHAPRRMSSEQPSREPPRGMFPWTEWPTLVLECLCHSLTAGEQQFGCAVDHPAAVASIITPPFSTS